MPGSGYTPISFTVDEIPSVTKWNLIGSNFASLVNGNALDDGVILNRHLGLLSVKSTNIDNADLSMFQSASVDNASNKTLSASETYLCPETITLTLTRSTKILFVGAVTATAPADTEFRIGIADNGTSIYTYGGQAVLTHGSRSIDRSTHRVLTLAAGTHNLRLIVGAAGGSGLTFLSGNAAMSVFVGV